MSQPKDLVSPDEIVAYIQERKVSEKAAAGIKLLRRAAETIAWQQDQFDNKAVRTEAAAEAGSDPTPPHDETLDQVALALGADFTDNLPWQYTLKDVLEYIENMHVQLTGLQQGIIERDQIIDRYEQPVSRTAEAACAEDNDQSVGCDSVGAGMSTEQWIQKATSFAHKVHGMTMVMDDTNGVRALGFLAEELTDNAPTL